MKKILFTTNIPAPYTVLFFENLGKQFDLTVVYERKEASNRDKAWFSEMGAMFKEEYLSGINVGEEAAFCPSICRYLKKNFDLIIIGNYSSPTGILSILYLKLMHKKFCIHVDGGIRGEREGIKKYLKKFLLSSAFAFFSPGSVTDEYIKYYAGVKKKIFHYPFSSVKEKEIISNPLSMKDKKDLLKRIGLGANVNNNEFVITSVGSVIYRKGYDVLLKALVGMCHDIVVFIIGGKPTEDLEKLIKDNQLYNVHFVEFKKHELIKEYLRASDLFVLPTRYDIWGLVINEALAAGVPVITSNKCVAGMQLIKDGYNGYIFKSEDSIELKKRIGEILSRDVYSREIMSRNCIYTAKGFTIEKMSQEYIRSIETLLQNGMENK